MEGIIKAVEILAEELTRFKGAVSHELAIISAEKEKNAILATRLSAQKEGLEVREAEVAKIENIVLLEKTAKEEMGEVNKKIQQLSRDKAEFDILISADRKSIAEANEKVAEARKANEREAAALNKLRADIEKEKEEFKMKIAVGLVNQAAK